MTASSLMGIDLGTSSVKVIVAEAGGTILGSGTASYPTSQPYPRHAEQDPAGWWRATVVATRAALTSAESADIAAIGVTGQMHGAVLLETDGTPLAPAIIWSDGRSASEVAAMTAEISAARVLDLTGSALAPGF